MCCAIDRYISHLHLRLSMVGAQSSIRIQVICVVIGRIYGRRAFPLGDPGATTLHFTGTTFRIDFFVTDGAEFGKSLSKGLQRIVARSIAPKINDCHFRDMTRTVYGLPKWGFRLFLESNCSNMASTLQIVNTNLLRYYA